jgi:hypothetical protein
MEMPKMFASALADDRRDRDVDEQNKMQGMIT